MLNIGALAAIAGWGWTGCRDSAGSDPGSGAEPAAIADDGPTETTSDGLLTTVGRRIPFDFAVLLPTVPPLKVGEGELGVKASDCGQCHRAIYDEWKGSTHASSMRDPQYYAEISKPGAPRWLCLNCHAPVQNQRRWMITAQTKLRDDPLHVSDLIRTPNPDYDPEMQREGVTCAACHVRVDEGRAYVVAANVSGRSPHPVRANGASLRNICLRCHSPGEGRITPVFFCWFETHQEGEASGVSKDCVDCHMPPVRRAIVDGGPTRNNRHHYWTGGGVPKTFEAYDSLLERAYAPGLAVEATIDTKAGLTVRLRNDRAGHHVTSGDPERFIWVRTEVDTADGSTRLIDARRFGQRWDWGRLAPTPRHARRVADNRIPAGRSVEWTMPLPDGWRRVVVDAAHVRLVPSNARLMKSTKIPTDLADIWPAVAGRVADIEDHYPMMTWFARLTTTDGRRWRRAPLEALMKASKDLRGTTIEDYEAILTPPKE